MFALVAFAGSLALGHWLYPHFSANNDEPIYVLQAQAMRHGHITLSAQANSDFFRPWMSGHEGGHVFLVVQPVLPALLALSDLVFGSMRVALGLIAAGAVIAMFFAVREVLDDERVALVAAGLFALSPLVIFQSALYLTYVLAVALTAVVITLVSQGVERTTRWRLLLAGLVHGVLLFTRPIEALMLAVVLIIWISTRNGFGRLMRASVYLVLGAIPIGLLMLAFNKATTGNPIRFPLWAIGGNDSFGFGDRSITPGAPVVHYGLSEAWLTLRTNLRAFPHWLLGGIVTVPLIGFGAWRLWKTNRSAFALAVSIAVIYPLGYFFYWGNYLIIAGRDLFGPHYYLALLIPSSILVAVGLVDLARRRPVWLAVLIPAILVGTLVEVGNKVDANIRYRDGVAAEVDAVDATVKGDGVVVVPTSADGAWILHPRGQFGNAPDLSGHVLYAADLLGRNVELFDRFPNRAVYRLQQVQHDGKRHADVRALQRVRRPSFNLAVGAAALPDHPTVDVYAFVDGQTAHCVLTRTSTDSARYQATVQLDASTITLNGCVDGPQSLPMPTSPSTIAIGVHEGPDLDSGPQVEQRYWVRPNGAELDVVTPADTWERSGPADSFSVLDPNDTTFATFQVQ